MKLWCALLMLPLLCAAAVDRGRVERLEKSLLASCCYREPISRHQSDAATRMRLELARELGAGKSDTEILNTFRARYSERVVVEPEPDPSPWVTAVPWLATLAGALLVAAILRRWMRPRGVPVAP